MDYFDADAQRDPPPANGDDGRGDAPTDTGAVGRDIGGGSPMRTDSKPRDDFRGRSRSRSPVRRSRSPYSSRGGDDAPRRRFSPPPPPRPRHAPANVEPTNIVGVFGLSIRTTERDLEEEFSRVAAVDKAVIVYDARSDRSRGFGFVTMRELDGAAAVIKELNGIDLHGRRIRVDYSATHRAHEPTPGQYMGHVRADDRWRRDGPAGARSPPPRGGSWRDRDRDYGPPPPLRGYADRDRDRDYGRDRYGGGGGGYDSRPPPPSRSRYDDDWRRRSPPPRRGGPGSGGGRSPSPPPRRYRTRSRSPPPPRATGEEPPFEP
ncbi:hypothetical protein OC845_001393 [Tilletia horrida]|nr:hypothetical protein OC845_001393 [Tilletia horrida]